jgi:hypothetical protein
LQNCFFNLIHDNTFSNLGVVLNPSGHAASIFNQASVSYIYHNYFYSDFANCTRSISQSAIPAMTALFTSWDANYDGVGRFYGNILDSVRKYPMFEDQKDTIGMLSLTYMQPMRSFHVWNNTMYRGGMGANNNSPYNVSVYDWYKVAYTTDTLELHNCVEVGPPTDTAANVCYSQACVALITEPNGSASNWDTSGNQFYQLMTFATSGLADTSNNPIGFYPLLDGLLYNNGVSTPAWLATDFHGRPVPAAGRTAFARNTGVDVGASQAPPGFIGPIPVGSKIILN